MAELTINLEKILENIYKISELLNKKNIKWSLITKMLNGRKDILSELLNHDLASNLYSIGDSRISNLILAKQINPSLKTMYIKPPPPYLAKKIVKYADVSLNTSLETISLLNRAAIDENKIHEVIIMIEMGELREGILRENILEFYKKVFELSNIHIIGIGTNLGCMYGIEPTYDKLIQLLLYKKIIELTFNKTLEIISAGSSITLPLITKNKIPDEINHFRIGESVFMGVTPLNNKKFRNLSDTAFEFLGEIIEIEEKNNFPDGTISDGSIGIVSDSTTKEEKSFRAIVDFGLIDVDIKDLIPKDKNIKFVGTTSDMTVYDLGNSVKKYSVGNKLKFSLNYMAAARLLNSSYITVKII